MTPEQFLTLADPLPEPMLLLTCSGVVLAGNHAIKKQLGTAFHEFRYKNLADAVADSPQETAQFLRSCSRSRSLVLGSLTLVAKCGASVAYRAEGTLLIPKTNESEALLMLRIIPKEAAVGKFVALNQRIENLVKENHRCKTAEAEARQEAERLRVTLHSIGDGVIVTDCEGRVQLINPVAQAMTGWTQDAATGVPLPNVFNIVNEDTRQPVENPALRALKEGTIVGLANHTILTALDGKEHPIDDCAAPIHDDEGRVFGSVLVFRDISERKQAEIAAQESEARLQLLLAEIHHRVKNNLQIIDSLLGMQSDTVRDTAAVSALKESQNRVKSMSLIHQILYESQDFSRVDFSGVIQNLVNNLSISYALETRKIDIVMDLERVYLPLDTSIPLGLILNELCSNALKYAFRDNRHGILEVSFVNLNSNLIQVAVSDNGVGIPEEFDMENTPSLGLQLVQLLSEQISAHLAIQRSNPTKFTLNIPLNK